jgi:hypothetical protein
MWRCASPGTSDEATWRLWLSFSRLWFLPYIDPLIDDQSSARSETNSALKMLIRLEGAHGLYESIFVRAAYPRAVAFVTLNVVGRPCSEAEVGLGTCC